MDWWYRNSFSIPRNKKGEKVKLILNGINYKAEIWFNRQLLGTMTGAFERYFDITPWVDYDKRICWPFVFFRLTIPVFLTRQIGKKELVPMVEHCAWMVLLFISSEGWDWIPGIRDRNMGIWQDVRVKFGNELEIVDTHVITDLPFT